MRRSLAFTVALEAELYAARLYAATIKLRHHITVNVSNIEKLLFLITLQCWNFGNEIFSL